MEMMLQRQVPARPVPRMNDAASSAKSGEGTATELFSAVLKGENRQDAKDRDLVEPDDDAGVEPDPDAVGPEIKVETGSGQSDEMLALLAALMSSAAYDDEAKVGAGPDQDAELAVPENAEPLEADAEADPAMSDDPASIKSMIDTRDVEAGAAAASAPPTMTDREITAEQPGKTRQQEPAAPARSAKADKPAPAAEADDPASVAKAENLPAPAQTRGPVAAAQPAEATASPAAALSALAGATAKTGRAGQGAQAPDKPQAPQAATGGKDGTVESREALRTLGLTDEATRTGTGSGKPAVGEETSGSGRKQAAAEHPEAEKSGARSGNVEVVDSRRFMAPAQLSGNAQLITRSLAEASDAALTAHRAAPAQSAAAAAQPQTGQMLHTLKLQLNPASLGSVTAVLKLSGEDLSVAIQVETAEAYRQLNDDNQSILKALRSQGYGVEQITIQHVASSSDRSASQTPQQGFQGGNPGGASADAQSSSGRENGGNGSSQQRTNQHGGQGREQSQYPGSGSGRSDGVYL